MKKTATFAALSAVFGALSASAAVDCLQLSLSVKQSVANDQSKVLEIVSKEVATAPACACEIVKAAIEGSKADNQKVAAIVEVAATAAPEQMRLVSQCAVAVAPDALASVQSVMAKLDPNRGESAASGKSAKSSKDPGEVAAQSANPLDFPGKGPVGPTPGGQGGITVLQTPTPVLSVPPNQVIPPTPPPVVIPPTPTPPPVIDPPPVTNVNP